MVKKPKATTPAALKPFPNEYPSLDDLDSENTSLQTAGRPYSPNHMRTLSTDFPLGQKSSDPVGASWLQKKRRHPSSTDSMDQGSRSPLWISGSANAGRLKETQKKRRYLSSTDSIHQGRQSPFWAPGLATAGRLKELQTLQILRTREIKARFGYPAQQQRVDERKQYLLLQRKVSTRSHPFSNSPTNSSFIYEQLSREQGIGHIIQDEPTGALYFKVKPSAILLGWSNDPEELSLDYVFSRVEANMRIPFQSQLGMPNPVPVVANSDDGLWLIDSGDGRYYFWEAVADSIFEIYEQKLAKILSTMSEKNGGLVGTKYRTLGIVGCEGILNYNAEWEVPQQ